MIRKEDGAGGKYMKEFIERYILSRFDFREGEISLSDQDDAGDFKDYVLTADTYVVHPPVFPGGNIGKLAICGTSNDLAVMGARPSFMSLSLVIQEGFDTGIFEEILDEMKVWIEKTDTKILTGDTKVIDQNIGIIINTGGIGERNRFLEKNLSTVREYRSYPWRWIRDRGAGSGEAVVISGRIAEHGIAVLNAREEFDFQLNVRSDAYPVWLFFRKVLEKGGVTSAKDPTRGGIANALNEISEKSGVGMVIEEERIPLDDEVRGFCEALGLDPLSIANEGKVVFTVVDELADDILKVLRRNGQKHAEIIGYTTDEFPEVVIETSIGTRRILPPPVGDPIPRVC